jgi:hypothetical protein
MLKSVTGFFMSTSFELELLGCFKGLDSYFSSSIIGLRLPWLVGIGFLLGSMAERIEGKLHVLMHLSSETEITESLSHGSKWNLTILPNVPRLTCFKIMIWEGSLE